MGEIELFDIYTVKTIECFKIEMFDHLTVCIYKMCLQIIFI